MKIATTEIPPLAYDDRGAGCPVLLIHGLTFDRRSWRPVIDALDGSLRTIAVDMPAHGQSAGPPASAEGIARRISSLLDDLEIVNPIVVGHSYGAAVAAVYAAGHPASGLVMIDSGPAIQSFAELAQRVAPKLRGPEFAATWQMFESSLGLERIPEPSQALVRAAHRVEQDVVLGYWHQMLVTPPADFQSWIDSKFAKIDRPVLAIFGSTTPDADRERLGRLRDVRIEEHPGEGHFVHLVDPARTASSLRGFVGHCMKRTTDDLNQA